MADSPPIYFKWLFNSRPVLEFAGISTAKMGKQNSIMTIDSVNGRHSGNYTCQGSNAAMIVNFTAVLIINGIVIILVQLQLYFCLKF